MSSRIAFATGKKGFEKLKQLSNMSQEEGKQSNLWTSVDNSSLISAYRYNAVDSTLDVQFKSNGAKYRYHFISEHMASKLKDDDSPGKYIHQHVIKAGKPYDKL